MLKKAAPKRYFNENATEAPGGKKQKKQKDAGGPKESPNPKKKMGAPKENGDAKKLAFPGTGVLKKGQQRQKAKPGAGAKAEPNKEGNRAQRRRARCQEQRNLKRKKFRDQVAAIKSGDKQGIEMIKAKMAAIHAQPTLSNTGRRKLKKLESVLKMAGVQYDGKKSPMASKLPQAKKAGQVAKKQNQAQQKKSPLKKGPLVAEEKDSDESKDSEYDAEELVKPENTSGMDEDDDDDSEENEEELSTPSKKPKKGEFLSFEGEEDSDDDEEASDEEDDDEDDEDDEDDDDDDDDAEDEEESSDEVQLNKSPKVAGGKQQNQQGGSPQKGKSRYVVFVGNLPFDVEKQQIMEHFKKVGEIQDVRIATDQNTKKGRGFAYVEVKNEESYQKALGLNNTFINGRKINVQYTQGGKKKGDNAKKEIKAKNMKLQAMKKQGKFGGGKNPAQNRADRRKKQGAK